MAVATPKVRCPPIQRTLDASINPHTLLEFVVAEHVRAPSHSVQCRCKKIGLPTSSESSSIW